MAQVEPEIVETKLFFRRVESKTLTEAVAEYFKVYGEGFALLYSPKAAYLAKLKSENLFVASSGQETAPVNLGENDWQNVFEARVFNNIAELRWLNEASGKGAAVVLCDKDSLEFFGVKPESFKTNVNGEEKDIVDANEQTYLLWGQSTDKSQPNGWTQFAEARIGSFFVPVKDITKKNERAQFRAIEYLGEYEDGNLAVCEERLIGIEYVKIKTEAQNNG